uniref:Major facilitator superfamily (MFS) profile domain-containing protein n=1 Tax=Eubacterium plexicaudatum ASF492 TaxID=1235802 RepID=N2ABT0_9FIRM
MTVYEKTAIFAFPVFVFCSFIMGASGSFFNVPLLAHIQETVAPEMMGKVISLLSTAMTLATPFGLLLAGPVSEIIGVERWFVSSGILMMAAGVFCLLRTKKFD